MREREGEEEGSKNELNWNQKGGVRLSIDWIGEREGGESDGRNESHTRKLANWHWSPQDLRRKMS